MNLSFERWLGVLGGLAAGVALLYYLYGPRLQDAAEPEPEPPPAAAPAPAPTAQAEPQYPVPAPPVAEDAAAPAEAPATSSAAPADLAASDEEIRQAAAELFGKDIVEAFLIRSRIIQNVVATVDSLDRDPVPQRFRAIGAVPDLPVVEKQGERLVLSRDNAARYRVLVTAFGAASGKAIASLYLRYYPLFERAYRELGYPDAYFNDRVVQVIDHLLAAPEPEGPIELVRPKVLYRYADPALEALSSGHKIMLRIGPQNAAAVKSQLREIRAVIAAGRRG